MRTPPDPSRTPGGDVPAAAERRVVAAVVLGGLAVFLSGAGIATTVGAWDLRGAAYLEAVSTGSSDAWTVGNLLLALGVAASAAGMAALAGRVGSALARAGGALWLVAAGVGAVNFLGQGYATLAAADSWGATGEVPDGFLIIDAWRESGLLVFYAGVGMLATALLGAGLTMVAWLPRWVGVLSVLVGVSGAILIFLGVDLIPAFVQFATAIVGVGVLLGHAEPAGGGVDDVPARPSLAARQPGGGS